MSWDVSKETRPIASKSYHCQASDWIQDLDEMDFEPEDWETILKARAEGNLIKPGARYIKVTGKWDGDWSTFRARIDLNDICQKYDLYRE